MEAAHASDDKPNESRRLQMQSWEMLPAYLSEHLWQRLESEERNTTAALEEVVTHAFKVGLRAPSEMTQAVLTAIVAMKQPEDRRKKLSGGGPDLRSLYLNVKGHVHTILNRMRSASLHELPGKEYLTSLPADPTHASEALRCAAFPPAGQLVKPKWPLMDAQGLSMKVPLRSTNKSATHKPDFVLMGAGAEQMMAATSQAMMMFNAAFQMAAQQRQSSVPVTLTPRPKPLENLLSRAESNTSLRSLLEARAPLALEDRPAETSPKQVDLQEGIGKDTTPANACANVVAMQQGANLVAAEPQPVSKTIEAKAALPQPEGQPASRLCFSKKLCCEAALTSY